MSRPTAEVTLIGHSHIKAHLELRDFLTRIAQPYNWLEAGACGLDFRAEELPAVLVPYAAGGEVLVSATVKTLAEAWDIRRRPEADHYDLAILGGGPAGLAAAVYAASDGLSTIVVETELPGGQAGYTSNIENFFGFPEGIGGAELSQLAITQATEFGAEVCSLAPAIHVEQDTTDGGFMVNCAKDRWDLHAKQIVGATGMQWRKMPAIDELPEVFYGAGRSEVIHSVDQRVAIIGAGNSAGQAAMSFAEGGAKVKLLVRGSKLSKSMSTYLVDRIEAHPNVEVQLDSEVSGGGESHRGLELVVEETHAEGNPQQSARVETVDKAFICIGGVPRTSWANGLELVHEKGFLKTGPDLLQTPQAFWEAGRPPMALETSVPGLFAAGDVRWGASRRVGGAVGDGSAVVALAHRVRS